MDTENLKLFVTFLRNELFGFFLFVPKLYKEVHKFLILPISAETPRETTEVKRRQKKGYICVNL